MPQVGQCAGGIIGLELVRQDGFRFPVPAEPLVGARQQELRQTQVRIELQNLVLLRYSILEAAAAIIYRADVGADMQRKRIEQLCLADFGFGFGEPANR